MHQIEMLKKHGDIVQMDLPGHGNSDAIFSYEMNALCPIAMKFYNRKMPGKLNEGESAMFSKSFSYLAYAN
jgi:hypothetical protein